MPLSPDPASSMLGRRAAHLQGHRLSTRPASKYWAGVCRLHMTSEDGARFDKLVAESRAAFERRKAAGEVPRRTFCQWLGI